MHLAVGAEAGAALGLQPNVARLSGAIDELACYPCCLATEITVRFLLPGQVSSYARARVPLMLSTNLDLLPLAPPRET